MKKAGEIKGAPVYVDPNVPPGMIYFINDKNIHHSVVVDARSRWQRIKDWVRRLFK